MKAMGLFRMTRATAMVADIHPGQDADLLDRTGVGFTVADGQLCVAIQTGGGVIVVALDHADLDQFCGHFADALAKVSPEAASLIGERQQWPTMQ